MEDKLQEIPSILFKYLQTKKIQANMPSDQSISQLLSNINGFHCFDLEIIYNDMITGPGTKVLVLSIDALDYICHQSTPEFVIDGKTFEQ